MTQAFNWILALALAAALCIIGPWLDGAPSDTDDERAAAADLHDALLTARTAQHVARAEVRQ
jgi:hypothetical protein